MFTFPLAADRRTWAGQGALVGCVPASADDSLGACFGICCGWLGDLATLEYKPAADDLGTIFATQAVMNSALASGVEHAIDVAAEAGGVETSIPLRSYPEGIASHVILDLLTATAGHSYLICFYYTSAASPRELGHAIAVTCENADRGRILDPNFGIGEYGTRTSLCNDLHNLLRSYVGARGALTASHMLEHDPFAA